MLVPNGNNSKSPLNGIANYQNFGLRESWIQVYCDEKNNFSKNTVLGGPMKDSARIWFRQAMLCKNSRTMEPGKLLNVAIKFGTDTWRLWELIWIGLCNNAPIVKWFVTTCDMKRNYDVEELMSLLGDLPNSKKNSGLKAMFNLLKSTPLGSDSGVVRLGVRGAVVTDVTRVRRSISALSALYSLYLIGQVSDRTSFTLSEMMHTDFSSAYISPLVAFGISVEEFKGQCLALASKYPSFISCSFTLGLDEIKIYPSEKSLDDVLDLVLE